MIKECCVRLTYCHRASENIVSVDSKHKLYLAAVCLLRKCFDIRAAAWSGEGFPSRAVFGIWLIWLRLRD